MNQLTKEQSEELERIVSPIRNDRSYLVDQIITAQRKIKTLENILAAFILLPVASVIVYLFFGG